MAHELLFGYDGAGAPSRRPSRLASFRHRPWPMDVHPELCALRWFPRRSRRVLPGVDRGRRLLLPLRQAHAAEPPERAAAEALVPAKARSTRSIIMAALSSVMQRCAW